MKFQSWKYGAVWLRGAQDENETLLVTDIGAAIAEGDGLVIAGNFNQFVPAEKGVLASRLGPGCPSPALPWPTALGYIMP